MKSVEWRPKNIVIDLARVVGTGVGGAVFVAISDGSAWAGVVGAIVGFAVVLAGEYVARLHREVRRLGSIERQAKTEREQRDHERELWNYELTVARRRLAVSEVSVRVWAGIVEERLKDDPTILGVVMARQQVELQAKNLDKPLPPPPKPPDRSD